MRIAFFSETFLPKIDGIVNTLCHLFDHLAARGHESILFAPDGGPDRYRMTRIVGLAGIPFPLYPELRLVPPVINVLDELRAFQPDLIHVINPVSLGYVGLRHARRLRLPLVASYHTDVPGFAARWGLRILYQPLLRFFRWMHNRADLNLCPSTVTQRQLMAQGYRHVQVWARGVDNQLFHPDRRSAAWRRRLTDDNVDSPLLLYVGRLSPEKRVDWLASVLDALPHARLAIVGDGPMRPQLERVFAHRPVHFTGYLRGADLAAAYASADLFVFPAANETLGNVVLEAMASGLPVVAPHAGGLLDYVVDGETGLLFAPESQASLVAAVQRLLDSPTTAHTLGVNGRSRMLDNSWERVHDTLLDQYSHLVHHRAVAARRMAA
ncbi:MAG TPA: glycosyltransferase family 1 protein [Chloroflexi bacterium]|nr:glycosyltransferase family 1 protein [Chloroflexota bacterium]